jgi:hypothetical protein
MSHPIDTVKNAIDGAAILVTVGTISDYLPALAALASIIWTGIRIGEWVTAKWRARHKNRT